MGGRQFMGIEETIFFYSRNDYLIINNLLCGNINHLWEVVELVNGDSKGVLKEHEDGVRALDKISVERILNRTYEKLDDNAKEKTLKTAKNDILNILSAMKPTTNDVLLYRTVWYERMEIGDILSRYSVNDIIEFKIISSTSIIPYMENAGHVFYRYEITVPKNGLFLELDQFDRIVRNEDGEVLLPPMKCKIKNIRSSDNENCRGIIELEYIEKIPVDNTYIISATK